MPSTWKLSRDWKSKSQKDYRVLVQPSTGAPPMASKSEEISPGTWKITLAWSEESLHEAAYEMTFWYMAQVGRHIYTKKPLPKDWEGMSPKQAGYNTIKMMLYYILLGPLSATQEKKAIKLYNIYCFGYSLGADSKAMLWPEDFAG